MIRDIKAAISIWLLVFVVKLSGVDLSDKALMGLCDAGCELRDLANDQAYRQNERETMQ